MIPKIIHYCWFGGKPIPKEVNDCISSWERVCPDYQIKRWDESNFDYESCSYAKEAYSLKKWAFVSDYARFKILYEVGGIYFDTDVELIKPIDDVVENGPFMACESSYSFRDDLLLKKSNSANGVVSSIATGLGMAFERGDGVLKRILDDYDQSHFTINDVLYDKTTVVSRVSKLMESNGFDKFSSGIQIVNGITIYPKEFFSGRDNLTGEMIISDDTRSIHHGAASWINDEEKAIVRKRKEYKGKGKIIFLLGSIRLLPNQVKQGIVRHGLKNYIYSVIYRLLTGINVGVVDG